MSDGGPIREWNLDMDAEVAAAKREVGDTGRLQMDTAGLEKLLTPVSNEGQISEAEASRIARDADWAKQVAAQQPPQEPEPQQPQENEEQSRMRQAAADLKKYQILFGRERDRNDANKRRIAELEQRVNTTQMYQVDSRQLTGHAPDEVLTAQIGRAHV